MPCTILSIHNSGSTQGWAHWIPKTPSTSFCWKKKHFWISWSWVMTCVSNSCFDICLQVHSGAFTFHCLWQSIAGKPLPLHDIAVKYCMHILMHIPLCSSVRCFGTHLAQILWYPRSSWMMEYVDPQLIPTCWLYQCQ